LGSLAPHTGLFLMLPYPTIAPVVTVTQYAPVDVLFIDAEGHITQIAPNLVLADLKEDIYPDNEILALLMVKGGSCEELSIHPGDSVIHDIFKKPPQILGKEPALKKPAAPVTGVGVNALPQTP
jgi:Uncharacterized conserved protein